MTNPITILESLTKLEVLLLLTVIGGTIAFYFKLGYVELLKQQSLDLRVNNHNLYMMYMQLSNQSLEFVKKWETALKDKEALLERYMPPSSK